MKNFQKDQRDAVEVFANGAVAACLALTGFVTRLVGPGSAENDWIWDGIAGSLAAATADTWGTELGVPEPASTCVDHHIQTRGSWYIGWS